MDSFFLPLLNMAGLGLALLVLLILLLTAPWQVLLLLLVVGLLVTNWLMRQNASHEDLVSSQAADELVRQYRGSSYKLSTLGQEQPITPPQLREPQVLSYRGSSYNPSEQTTGQSENCEPQMIEVTGKYRGCTWKKTNS